MPLGDYISISRLAPAATPNEQRRYVALRGYFDGSGRNEPQHKAMTLAGLSASESVWPDFELAWNRAVQSLGFKRWRTSTMHDFMTPQAFREAAMRLLDVVLGFRARPMVSYQSTVILEDYRRAKAEIPALIRAEALCINGTVGNLVIPRVEDLPAILYFDRDEPFKSHIEGVWRQRRERFDRGDWSHQIEDILPTHWDKCGIQAADLFAWLGNTSEVIKRRDSAPETERQMVMELSLHAFFSAHPRGIVYDYDKIVAAHRIRGRG
jgi:hypothetical protein